MLTDTTRVLMSFGAVDGGFELAMQLRLDVYKKFLRNAHGDPAFCYLDAESLRSDANTSYTYDPRSDKNMMANRNWDSYYEAAMVSCRTMVLLITKPWLTSKWCWREMDMLIRVAERKRDMKIIIAWWPDAVSLMQTGSWQERQDGGQARTPQDLWARINRLNNRKFDLRVSGTSPVTGSLSSGGSNTFAYACTDAERQLILGQVEA